MHSEEHPGKASRTSAASCSLVQVLFAEVRKTVSSKSLSQIVVSETPSFSPLLVARSPRNIPLVSGEAAAFESSPDISRHACFDFLLMLSAARTKN